MEVKFGQNPLKEQFYSRFFVDFLTRKISAKKIILASLCDYDFKFIYNIDLKLKCCFSGKMVVKALLRRAHSGGKQFTSCRQLNFLQFNFNFQDFSLLNKSE